MSAKSLLTTFALALGLGVVALWATPAPAQPANPEKKAEKTDKDADKLQKEVEEALKELEKLSPPAPQPLAPRPGGGGGNINPEQLKMLLRGMPGGMGGLGLNRGGLGGAGGAPAPAAGRLGITNKAVQPEFAEHLKSLPEGTGQIVASVRPESPAAKAGILRSDILIEMNGKPVPNDSAQFGQDVRDIKAGVEFNVVVLRKGQKEVIKGIVLPENAAAAPQLDDPFGQMDQLPPDFQKQLQELQQRMNMLNNRALILPGIGGLGGLGGIGGLGGLGGLPGGLPGGRIPQAAPRPERNPQPAPAPAPQKKKTPEIF